MTVLNVHEFGDPAGAPLLAVHGITAHGLRYRRLAEEALPARRTIAVDLRGHGRSTSHGPWSIAQHVRDLVDTLDHLGLEQVDYVGHSYGGAIGIALLAAAPERIGRLVLLDPALEVPGDKSNANAQGTIDHQGWATIDEATIARNNGLGDEINPGVIEDMGQHLVEIDGRFWFRYHKPAVVTGWGEVCGPLPSSLPPKDALLLVADRADLVSAATEAKLVERLPGLEVVHLDSGHMVLWERFDETADMVARFLAR